MNKNYSNSVCRYLLIKLWEDVRWKIIFLFLALLFFNGTYRINQFCASFSIAITPWIFPHVLSRISVHYTLIIGFLMILCNLPFWDNDSTFALTRSGHLAWGIGVLKTISVVSLFFVGYIFVLSFIFLLPSLSFERGWGKVLMTFAKDNSLNSQYSPWLSISNAIVTRYSPFQAILLSLFLEYLCLNILALIVLLVNLLLKGNIGIGAGLITASLDFFIRNDVGDKSIRFSPVSLTNLSVIDPTQTSFFPSPLYASLFLLCLYVCFCSIAIWIIAKRKYRQ
ncbi:MAG: hypothetical protein IJ214_07965 [Clostridia bacterium]|nr:hypothetical protein [Clostridia bacterium]